MLRHVVEGVLESASSLISAALPGWLGGAHDGPDDEGGTPRRVRAAAGPHARPSPAGAACRVSSRRAPRRARRAARHAPSPAPRAAAARARPQAARRWAC
jgi:hypothetical protein